MRAIRKNAEALVVTSKETGIEVNAEKTKYMVMSCDQHAITLPLPAYSPTLFSTCFCSHECQQ
jgi:hypothetical protein